MKVQHADYKQCQSEKNILKQNNTAAQHLKKMFARRKPFGNQGTRGRLAELKSQLHFTFEGEGKESWGLDQAVIRGNSWLYSQDKEHTVQEIEWGSTMCKASSLFPALSLQSLLHLFLKRRGVSESLISSRPEFPLQ